MDELIPTPPGAPPEGPTSPVAGEAAAGLEPGMTIVRQVRGPRRWPGILASILALLMLAATGSGIAVASRGPYAASTGLAYLAIALSVAAIVTGIAAIAGRWGRGAGIAGVIVAVLGNPLVLLYGLSALGGVG